MTTLHAKNCRTESWEDCINLLYRILEFRKGQTITQPHHAGEVRKSIEFSLPQAQMLHIALRNINYSCIQEFIDSCIDNNSVASSRCAQLYPSFLRHNYSELYKNKQTNKKKENKVFGNTSVALLTVLNKECCCCICFVEVLFMF